jgi:hypothetical protein
MKVNIGDTLIHKGEANQNIKKVAVIKVGRKYAYVSDGYSSIKLLDIGNGVFFDRYRDYYYTPSAFERFKSK